LVVASGLTCAQTRPPKKFVDCHAFRPACLHSPRGVGVPGVQLTLATGPPPAPKPRGAWLAALELSFEVRLYWLPQSASWLDQVELSFSKGQRAVLTPTDFPRTRALERTLQAYLTELNDHPNPIPWTYTTTHLLAQVSAPPPLQLAA
jgi:hypothetical protein